MVGLPVAIVDKVARVGHIMEEMCYDRPKGAEKTMRWQVNCNRGLASGWTSPRRG